MSNKNSIFFLLFIFLLASCGSPKRIVYFYTKEKQDTDTKVVNVLPRPKMEINSDDILAITVSSADAINGKDPNAIFNDGGVMNSSAPVMGTGGQGQKGYLVDASGDIEFPVVGKIKVAGLSIEEAKATMVQKLQAYIKSPIVEIRIINYKINLMGEVARVGPIFAPNHKINILEAITAAGDIPMTGKKDRVMVIRQNGNNKLEFGRVNLNSTELFTSPYYYLQKNDIVYVEPNRLKRQQTNEFLLFYLPTISTLIASALSIYGIVQLTKR